MPYELTFFHYLPFSFTLKNEGEVKLNYLWNVQPGKYTPEQIVEEEELSPTNQQQRESKSSQRESRRPVTNIQKPPTVVKTKAKSPSNLQLTDQLTTEGVAGTGESSSVAAHSADGRPASAIVLAYDASVSCDSRSVEDLPFTVEPRQGNIPAGTEATFTVRFSPLEINVFDAVLLCL